MSFSENPFKHLSVVIRDEGVFAGVYCWECGSCGAEVPLADNPVKAATISIAEAHAKFMSHVKNSHERTPEDFKDWS